jgi:glutaredoxin
MHATFAHVRRMAPHLLAVAGLVALPALGQGVYRIVGPDGRVTYSDQPPPANTQARPVTGAGAPAAASQTAALPFALRQTSSRYPVTLYTSAECNPCRSGIAYLERRGIPFTERTVETNADIQALQRLSGETTLPLLTVGSQQLRGFAESDWKQYLDAAGYPAESALPPGYRRAAATPLVSAAEAQPSAAPAQPRQPARAAPPQTNSEPASPPVTPPSGIRF